MDIEACKERLASHLSKYPLLRKGKEDSVHELRNAIALGSGPQVYQILTTQLDITPQEGDVVITFRPSASGQGMDAGGLIDMLQHCGSEALKSLGFKDNQIELLINGKPAAEYPRGLLADFSGEAPQLLEVILHHTTPDSLHESLVRHQSGRGDVGRG